jgi:acyl carrier protein
MYDQLKRILVTKFQIDPSHIQPKSTLTDLELDSLDVVELALVIEQELGAKVSDDELFDIQQLEDIAVLAKTRRQAAV